MASTIIIKNGAGTDVPSSLKQGELAINVDNGKLFYGTSGSSNAVSSSFSFQHITASGDISASGAIEGNSFSLTNAGDNLFSIDNTGDVSASRGFAGTQIRLATNGVTKASIDSNGTGSFAYISTSENGKITAPSIEATANYRLFDESGTTRHIITGINNTLNIGNTNFDRINLTGSLQIGLGGGTDNSVVVLQSNNILATDEIDAGVWGNAGAVVTAGGEVVAPLATSAVTATTATNVTAVATTEEDAAEFFIGILDGASGNQGVATSTKLKQNPSTGKLTVLGDISSSALMSATSLDIRTAGVQKAAITSDGSASFAGGIDTFYDATSSLGYISASHLIVQGTDQNAAIALRDNDGNNIAHFARVGSGLNAHVGQMTLRDNADIKVRFKANNTCFVSNDFSSSAALMGNSARFAHNGINTLSIDTTGNISSSGLVSATSLDIKSAGVAKASISDDGNITATLLTTTNIQSGTDITYTADADGNEVGQHIFKDRTAVIATLDVEQASFDPSITSSNDISASGVLYGTSLDLRTAGVAKASIDTDGIIYAAGNISSSELVSATSLDIKTAGVAKASIDAQGTGSFTGGIDAADATGSFGYISSSGDISTSANIIASNVYMPDLARISFDDTLDGSDQYIVGGDHAITIEGDNHVNLTADVAVNLDTPLVAADGNISSSGVLSGTALTLTTAGVHKASIDASGNVAAEGYVSSSGALSGTSLSLTVNGASVRTGLIAQHRMIGYAIGDGTNFEFAKNMATNTAPFNHDISFGSDGLTAQTIQIMMRIGGIVINRACTLKKWTGWTTCQGSGTANVALFKVTPTRNDNTNPSPVLLHDYSYTALGNGKMEDFDLTSFTVSSLAAGDIIISGMKSADSQLQYFTSMFEVEFS